MRNTRFPIAEKPASTTSIKGCAAQKSAAKSPARITKKMGKPENGREGDSIKGFGERAARPRARPGARRRPVFSQQPPQTAVSFHRLARQLRQWDAPFYRF